MAIISMRWGKFTARADRWAVLVAQNNFKNVF